MSKLSLLKIIVIIVAAATLSFSLVSKQKSHPTIVSAIPPIPSISPTPIIAKKAQAAGPILFASRESPEGSKELLMKKEEGNLTTYSFFILDNSENLETPLYSTRVNSSQSYSIPYNAWSPDDKYVFIKEDTNAGANYYVFLTSGKPFSDVSPYIEITSLFTQKFPGYKIEDVTGWADPNLLIINTRTETGGFGPSFWFAVSSRSFIQLATRFY